MLKNDWISLQSERMRKKEIYFIIVNPLHGHWHILVDLFQKLIGEALFQLFGRCFTSRIKSDAYYIFNS